MAVKRSTRGPPRGEAPDLDRDASAAAWLAENRDAVTAWNDLVDAHGVPLAPYREF
jgi:post-segregation antitoxin (ccd killing protein)